MWIVQKGFQLNTRKMSSDLVESDLFKVSVWSQRSVMTHHSASLCLVHCRYESAYKWDRCRPAVHSSNEKTWHHTRQWWQHPLSWFHTRVFRSFFCCSCVTAHSLTSFLTLLIWLSPFFSSWPHCLLFSQLSDPYKICASAAMQNQTL